MKKMAVGLLALALGIFGVNAGYESVSAPKAARVQAKAKGGEVAGIVDRAVWKGGMVLADGREIVLENAGGYFLPIELKPGIKCKMWFSGAGLVPGRPVTLFTMHGGLINGKVQDEVAVGEDACLRFEYRNGTFGAQPIQATIFGNTATLMTVKAKDAGERTSKKGAANEDR